MERKRKSFFDQLTDPKFRQQVIDNPRAAFKKTGLKIDENTQIKVVTNTANEVNIVMPAHDSNNVIPEYELEAIAAGELVVVGTIAAFGIGFGAALALAGAGLAVAWEYDIIDFNF